MKIVMGIKQMMLFWGLRAISHAPFKLSSRLSRNFNPFAGSRCAQSWLGNWCCACITRSESRELLLVLSTLILEPWSSEPCAFERLVACQTEGRLNIQCIQLGEYRSCTQEQSLQMEEILCCHSFSHEISAISSCTEDWSWLPTSQKPDGVFFKLLLRNHLGFFVCCSFSFLIIIPSNISEDSYKV